MLYRSYARILIGIGLMLGLAACNLPPNPEPPLITPAVSVGGDDDPTDKGNDPTSDITGEWSGTLVAVGEEAGVAFQFEMVINQFGLEVEGTTRSTYTANGSTISTLFKGTYQDGLMRFTQYGIVSADQIGDFPYWCIIQGELRYAEPQGIATLSGGYSSDFCEGGTITLEQD